MNPIAKQLNEIIGAGNPHLMEMLSDTGTQLFFPKGILTRGQRKSPSVQCHRRDCQTGGANHVF